MPKPSLFMLALTLSLAVSGGAFAFTYGDPAAGAKVFEKCQVCHTTELAEQKIGPSLSRLVGRVPGSIPGFGYSQNMIDFAAAGNIWTPETLDLFLASPRALLPRTKMAFPGLRKASDRADLIAYLAQF